MDLHTIKIVFLLVTPFFIMSLLAIIHASQREFPSLGQKVFWMLVAATPFIGFIAYFLIGRRKALPNAQP